MGYDRIHAYSYYEQTTKLQDENWLVPIVRRNSQPILLWTILTFSCNGIKSALLVLYTYNPRLYLAKTVLNTLKIQKNYPVLRNGFNQH